MLLGQAKQFYEDLNQAAQLKATDLVPESHVVIFNVILTEAKKQYPDNTFLQSIPDARRESFGAMLVPAGQIYRILADAASLETVHKIRATNQSFPHRNLSEW